MLHAFATGALIGAILNLLMIATNQNRAVPIFAIAGSLTGIVLHSILGII